MKHQKASLLVGAAALALAVYPPSAFAANTIRVDGTTTPPGAVAITGNNTGLGNIGFVTNFGDSGSCTSSAVSGYVNRGAAATAGTQIGAVTTMTFSPCTRTTLNYPVVITKKPVPAEWSIVVRTPPASKTQNVIDVTIKNVSARMLSTGSAPFLCHVEARGDVNATFNRTTQRLTIATAPAYPLNLTAYDTSGGDAAGNIIPPGSGTCVGQIETGDTASMSGNFNVITPGAGGIQLN
jgi:hypothetical protein